MRCMYFMKTPSDRIFYDSSPTTAPICVSTIVRYIMIVIAQFLADEINRVKPIIEAV